MVDVSVTSAFPDGDLDTAAELGAITDRTVRVWFRSPSGQPITFRLETDGQPSVVQRVVPSPATDWTGATVLELAEPAPDRPFVVTVAGRRLTARFAPNPNSHGDLTFAFGSCHHPFARESDAAPIHKTEAASIYPAIRERLAEADARFLMLIGDQIYADDLPGISVRDDLPGDENNPPPLGVAVDAYRKITRGFFAESGFRAVRESLPTFCMWDDHDIFNDWGSRLDERPLDQRLFAAADQVFREYQQARNPVTTELSRGDKPPYPFFTRFGTVGFLVLDLRGARDFQDGRLIGRQQWELIRDFFRSSTVANLHTLFIVASVPIAHTSRWLVELFQRLPWQRADSVRDRWCSSSFIASRDELLAECFAWQRAEPHRQVAMLSGDVHAASAFSIHNRRGPGTVHQFTSSAFTSPSVGMDRRINWLGSFVPNLFEPALRFDRHFLSMSNNVGLLRLQARPKGGHQITFDVHAWHPERRRLVPGGSVTTTPT